MKKIQMITKFTKNGGDIMESIKKELENNDYDYAVAIATKAEISAGAACGLLAGLDD